MQDSAALWMSWLGIFGVALVVGTLLVWVRLMQTVRVPQDLGFIRSAFAGGALLCLIAIFSGSTSLAISIPGWIAVAAAGTWLALDRIAAMPDSRPKIAIGEPAPGFQSTNSEGEPFDLASLKGRPVLLKFYRGFW